MISIIKAIPVRGFVRSCLVFNCINVRSNFQNLSLADLALSNWQHRHRTGCGFDSCRRKKGEFRFQPISTFVYIFVLSQSHSVKRRLTKDLHVVVEVTWRLAASEYFTFSHEIDVYCLQDISLQLPRRDLWFIAFSRKDKLSTFALTEGQIL